MNYLETIHENTVGAAYAVKNNNKKASSSKIQLQIGEAALLMSASEMPNFLNTIRAVNKKCKCGDCKQKGNVRVIKCETTFATISIKVKPRLIKDLEELVLAIICNYQIEMMLKANNIQ